jgi:toxin ParE1/3/4
VGRININITESAYADLEEIESYISQDSPTIARKFINKIFDRIEQLYNYPTSGKPVPEIKDTTLRELLLNKYRIIYQVVDEQNLNIIRIVHGSRLLDIEV